MVTVVLAGSRSALQLVASGGPVETSITPADVLAILCPQLGPTLAAVYKLVVVEGWLHHTAGEGKQAMTVVIPHFVQSGTATIYLQLEINTQLPYPLYSSLCVCVCAYRAVAD